MPSLKTFRNRIASVKATRKITRAMQMVAASKLKRAQDAALAARPYAEKMQEVIASLTGSMDAALGRAATAHRHGQRTDPSSDRRHRRPRPVRRLQHQHRQAGARRHIETPAARGKYDQNPLRRAQGPRSAEAPIRRDDPRYVRDAGRQAHRLFRRAQPSPGACSTCSMRASSTWRRCSSRASNR